MSYMEKVAEKIDASGQRVVERKKLWQTLASSFQQEGPDGIERHLRDSLATIQEEFDSTLEELDKML